MCPQTTHELAADPRNNPPSYADLAWKGHITELLRGRGWSFSDLVRDWILYNDGARGKRGRGHQKRTNILRSLPTDSDAMMKAMKDDGLWMDSIDIATTLFV